MLGQGEAVSRQDLSEDLGAHLEVVMFVKVLEERLGVKTVLPHNFDETLNNVVDNGLLLLGGLATVVASGGTCVVKSDVDRLFELLLCEDLINVISKVFPAHVFASLGRLEVSGQKFKFVVTNLNLAEVEADSELGVGDVTASKLIEITEEFADSNALHAAGLSDTGANVLNILWCVSNDLSN